MKNARNQLNFQRIERGTNHAKSESSDLARPYAGRHGRCERPGGGTGGAGGGYRHRPAHYDALTAKDALANLDTLRRFCWSQPEAQFSPEVDDDFNFYLTGETCDFWVRLITREKDYNMYLNAYAKADKSREAQ